MEQKLIDELVKQYECYNGSAVFIYAAFESLNFMQPKNIKSFISYSFQSNIFKDFSTLTFKGLSAHWNNVAYSKLNVGDYQGYSYASQTCRNFRIITHFLENNQSFNTQS
jgi:hypothetical protein